MAINLNTTQDSLMSQNAQEKIILSKVNATLQEVIDSLKILSKEIVEKSKPNAVFRETDEFIKNLKVISLWLVDIETRPGLMMGGLYGNGKTVTLMAVKELFHRCVINQDNHHIFFQSSIFIKAKKLISAKDETELEKAMDVDWLLIDEFGEEPTTFMDYGKAKSPIVDLLYYRYETLKPTIVTTNLSKDELKEKYGGRVSDRFNDMFDKIIYKAESFRGL